MSEFLVFYIRSPKSNKKTFELMKKLVEKPRGSKRDSILVELTDCCTSKGDTAAFVLLTLLTRHT